MAVSITWVNAAEKALGMFALAEKVGQQHAYEWGEDVSLAGEDQLREMVLEGGAYKTKKGGARYRTGDMLRSAESKTAVNSGLADSTSGFGVYHDAPYYTGWQEAGTKRGIPPMLAVPAAAIAMENEAADGGERMLARIARDWDAI